MAIKFISKFVIIYVYKLSENVNVKLRMNSFIPIQIQLLY